MNYKALNNDPFFTEIRNQASSRDIPYGPLSFKRPCLDSRQKCSYYQFMLALHKQDKIHVSKHFPTSRSQYYNYKTRSYVEYGKLAVHGSETRMRIVGAGLVKINSDRSYSLTELGKAYVMLVEKYRNIS